MPTEEEAIARFETNSAHPGTSTYRVEIPKKVSGLSLLVKEKYTGEEICVPIQTPVQGKTNK